VRCDQVGCPGDLARGYCVGDRAIDLPSALIPGARARVQVGDELGLRSLELLVQQLGEQVVVAVPAAGAIERDKEQVRALDRGQHLRSPGDPGHRVAELARQAVEYRGAEHESSPVRRQPGEDLVA
jgi:hypothetical protein